MKPLELQLALNQVFQTGRHQSYQRGSMMLRAGDIPSGIYLIESGYVRVYSLNPVGLETIIAVLKAGDIFPLAWAFNEYLDDVYFVAHEPVQVWRIARETFTEEVEQSPVFRFGATQALTRQSVQLAQELTQLSYRSAYDKVVYRLLALARLAGRRRVQQVVIQMYISHDYIAHSTGMSRETASRVLSKLTQQRLIRRSEGRIVIPDLEKLTGILVNNQSRATHSLSTAG